MRTHFIRNGLVAFLFVLLLRGTGLEDHIGVLRATVHRHGASAVIATAVVTVTIWVLLSLASSVLHTVGEEENVNRVRQWLSDPGRSLDYDGSVRWLASSDNPSEVMRARFRLVEAARRNGAETGRNGGRDEFLVNSQAGLDAHDGDASLTPLHSLIWALPALGFLGTASEMAHSVGGLGSAVARSADYAGLRRALVQDVIPPLAGAFDITVLALAATVLCYVLAALHARSMERQMVETNRLTLQILALDPSHAAPADQATPRSGPPFQEEPPFNKEPPMDGAAAPVSEGVVQLLNELRSTLAAVNDSLRADIVISRRARAAQAQDWE